MADESIDDLLERFGTELTQVSKSLSAKSPSPRKLRELASEWFSQNEARIAAALRSSATLRQLAYQKKSRDQQAIVALVIDVLAGLYLHVPLSTAALIITRYYLDHYIGEKNATPEERDAP